MTQFFKAYRPKSFTVRDKALALHKTAKEKPEYLQRFGIDVGLLNSRISLEIDGSGNNIENSLQEERDEYCKMIGKPIAEGEEDPVKKIQEIDEKIEILNNSKMNGVYEKDGKRIRIYNNRELNEFARRIWWKGYKWQKLISKK